MTGDWLFTNRDGEPIKAIKKGFTAARVRAGMEDLQPYDLRHLRLACSKEVFLTL
jgi:integrase